MSNSEAFKKHGFESGLSHHNKNQISGLAEKEYERWVGDLKAERQHRRAEGETLPRWRKPSLHSYFKRKENQYVNSSLSKKSPALPPPPIEALAMDIKNEQTNAKRRAGRIPGSKRSLKLIAKQNSTEYAGTNATSGNLSPNNISHLRKMLRGHVKGVSKMTKPELQTALKRLHPIMHK